MASVRRRALMLRILTGLFAAALLAVVLLGSAPAQAQSTTTVLYMVGETNDYLSTLNTSTGIATRVGTATQFGTVNEDNPTDLAGCAGTLYMVGGDNDWLYTIDTATGVATRVGTANEFGVSEDEPVGLACSDDGTLYMTGSDNEILYTLSTTTGVATAVDNATRNFGLSLSSPWGLAHCDSTLYMTTSNAANIYTLSTANGTATLLGATGATGAHTGLECLGSTLYLVTYGGSGALYTVDTSDGSATRVGSANQYGISESGATGLGAAAQTAGATLASVAALDVQDVDAEIRVALNNPNGLSTVVYMRHRAVGGAWATTANSTVTGVLATFNLFGLSIRTDYEVEASTDTAFPATGTVSTTFTTRNNIRYRLFAIDYLSDYLWEVEDVDDVTGSNRSIGELPADIGLAVSLTEHSDHYLYTIDISGSANEVWRTNDPEHLSSWTLVCSMNSSVPDIQALVSHNGLLYGFTNNQLYSFEADDCSHTHLGQLPSEVQTVRGAAMYKGAAYLADHAGEDLVRIPDLNTPGTQTLHYALPAGTAPRGLTVSHGQLLFLAEASRSIYRVNNPDSQSPTTTLLGNFSTTDSNAATLNSLGAYAQEIVSLSPDPSTETPAVNTNQEFQIHAGPGIPNVTISEQSSGGTGDITLRTTEAGLDCNAQSNSVDTQATGSIWVRFCQGGSVTLRIADDDNDNTYIDYTLTITGVGNSPPTFPSATTTRTIPENSPGETNVGTPVTAEDSNGDTLTYSMTAPLPWWDISETTGQIVVGHGVMLNFEVTPPQVVTVTASDGQTTDSIQVTISYTDVPEPPVFSADTATISVNENAAYGTNVGSPLVAVDPDAGAPAVTYSIGGPNGASFDVGASTGQITVATGTDLDYETRNTYTVILTASDGTLTSSITVTINVNNLAETAAPTIIPDPSTFDGVVLRSQEFSVGVGPGIQNVTITQTPGTGNLKLSTSGSGLGCSDPLNTISFASAGTFWVRFCTAGQTALRIEDAANSATYRDYTMTIRDPVDATITSVVQSALTNHSVTLTVNLNNPDDATTHVHVRRRLAGTSAWASPVSQTTQTDSTVFVIALASNQAYEFQVRTAAAGTWDTAINLSVTTPPDPVTMTALTVSDITGTTAQFTVSLYNEGGQAVTLHLRSRTPPDNSAYNGPTAQATITSSTHTFTVTGFQSDTAYSAQVGTSAAYTVARDVEFTTLALVSLVPSPNDITVRRLENYSFSVTASASVQNVTITETQISSGDVTLRTTASGLDCNNQQNQISIASSAVFWIRACSLGSLQLTVTSTSNSAVTQTYTFTVVGGFYNPTSIAISAVTYNSATATATVVNPDSQGGLLWLRYRTPPNSGTWSNVQSASVSGASDVQFSLTGLESASQYRVQVSATNAFDLSRTVTGTFTTLAGPTLSGLTVTGISTTDATFTATIADGGGQTRTVYFRYRFTPSGSWVTLITAQGTDTAGYTVTTLTAGAEYEVQASLSNTYSSVLSQTFTTQNDASLTSLTVTNISRTNATFTAAISYSYGATRTVYFRYRTTPSGAWAAGTANGVTTASFTVTTLTAETGYAVQASLASDYSGAQSTTFTTLAGTSIGDLTVSGITRSEATFIATIADGYGDYVVVTFRYRTLQPLGPWRGYQTVGGSTTTLTHTVTGLLHGTAHRAQVYLQSDSSILMSASFTTLTNAAPVFASATITRSVFESSSAGTPVGLPVTATDADGDTLSYTISGTDATSFSINSSTGFITVSSTANLDYETKSEYSVTVTATDPHGATGTTTVTISIINIREGGIIAQIVIDPIGNSGTTYGYDAGSYGTATGEFPEEFFTSSTARAIDEISEDAGGRWTLTYSGGSAGEWETATELVNYYIEVSYNDERIDFRRFVIGNHIYSRTGKTLVIDPPIPDRDLINYDIAAINIYDVKQYHKLNPFGPTLVAPVCDKGTIVCLIQDTTPGGLRTAQILITILTYFLLMMAIKNPSAWDLWILVLALVITPWVPVFFGFGDTIVASLVLFNAAAGAFAYKAWVARTEA